MITFFFFFFFLIDCLSLPYMIIFMIFMSVSIFSLFWSFFGISWLFLVFTLLFLGGILVVFMIVSSLFPNNKLHFNLFNKKLFFSFFLLFSLLGFNFNSVLEFKWVMFSGYNFFCLVFLVLSFFFCFLYMVSKDKISLRSFF